MYLKLQKRIGKNLQQTAAHHMLSYEHTLYWNTFICKNLEDQASPDSLCCKSLATSMVLNYSGAMSRTWTLRNAKLLLNNISVPWKENVWMLSILHVQLYSNYHHVLDRIRMKLLYLRFPFVVLFFSLLMKWSSSAGQQLPSKLHLSFILVEKVSRLYKEKEAMKFQESKDLEKGKGRRRPPKLIQTFHSWSNPNWVKLLNF